MENRIIDLDVLENYLKDRVLTQPRLVNELTNQVPDNEIGSFVLDLFKIFGKAVSVEINGEAIVDDGLLSNLPRNANNRPISLIFKDLANAVHPTSDIVLMYDDDISSWIKVRSGGNPLASTYPFITRLSGRVCSDLGIKLEATTAIIISHLFDSLKTGK